MKILVTDLETGVTDSYEYSNQNWRGRYACMKGDLVCMWAPKEVNASGYVITSGRKWILKERANP